MRMNFIICLISLKVLQHYRRHTQAPAPITLDQAGPEERRSSVMNIPAVVGRFIALLQAVVADNAGNAQAVV